MLSIMGTLPCFCSFGMVSSSLLLTLLYIHLVQYMIDSFPYDNYAGGVVKDQAEADEDTSLKNRALMAIGERFSSSIPLDTIN